MRLEDKINIVRNILKDKNVAIGFSGGSDSTLIIYLASMFAKNTLAVTIDNHLMPTEFIEHAKRVTSSLGVKHEIIDIDFYKDPDFLKNTPKRCYTCRNLMYGEIKKVANENGFDYICDGNNISDLVDDRPGILITYANEFKTPLIEAKLTSKEIHEYLDKNNIPYSKSTTCLATRIKTNTPITKEKIENISYCEDYILSNTECETVKVRDLGSICMCEVDKIDEIINENKFKQINDELKKQGYEKVSLNLSEIKNNGEIILNYIDGSFSYKLPFTINIADTKKQLKNKIICQTKEKIEIENIDIFDTGLIKGNNFKNYEDALNKFMHVLTKLRRNI
ncbi:uncharacterized protein SAMN05216439_1623 [Methanobrevibacter gottschalkii]|uniref:NAD/GMP synthase domain-containing protein n=1 Tax=Methanobrevibacter gottschalkii TaxID=190974 RepID=A0A1H7KN06_9EURY|nr:7-cyano-7-deazaguanine synthase [Methanobrevibacter gottschalkii]MCQ2970525.1 7-cyano-7-deazaguanine synthase [archaeon]SEK88148.1 uncharacterized protein SAMN05216439_1623 [Methanobrevibacter gottschalkii]